MVRRCMAGLCQLTLALIAAVTGLAVSATVTSRPVHALITPSAVSVSDGNGATWNALNFARVHAVAAQAGVA